MNLKVNVTNKMLSKDFQGEVLKGVIKNSILEKLNRITLKAKV